MNLKLVLRITGMTLLLEAACLVVPLLVCLFYGENPFPFLYSILILLVTGLALCSLKSKKDFFAREGFCTVGLIWLLLGMFGALPFWFSGQFGSYVDCLFETISGFTTTGSTILPQIEGLPYGLLFWRSFTHWLGGMGVLVLTSALLPSLGINSTYLVQAESPGPVVSKLVPKSSQSSKILYGIYLVMTVIQTILLRIAGMNWYDAVVHAMATAGTGGFSVRNLSVGAYANPAIDIIIMIFMLLFSVNFSVYFLLLCGKWKQVLASDELRFFGGMVGISTILIALNIHGLYQNWGDTFRHAAFQVASIVSTSGFATVDFDKWPEFSRMLLVLLMLIGACAGSTGGGIKCARVLVMVRAAKRETRRIIHPRSVNVVKLDGAVLPEATLQTILVFLFTYVAIMISASVLVGLDNNSFGTTLTAVITCLSNVGPGLELVGPMGNFTCFSAPSKLLLSLCMIVGRLEIFPILILFSKTAWKRS